MLKLLRRLMYGLLAYPLLVMADTPATPVGLWQAFNDQGKPTGYIRILEQDGRLRGVVERGLPTDSEDKRCTACKDQRKNQRMLGMEILWNLHKESDEYQGGEILDPFSGNIYRAKLSLLENGTKMKVRGYVGLSLFGRTQIWLREE